MQGRGVNAQRSILAQQHNRLPINVIVCYALIVMDGYRQVKQTYLLYATGEQGFTPPLEYMVYISLYVPT